LANDLNSIAADYAQQAMALRAAVCYSQQQQNPQQRAVHRGGGKTRKKDSVKDNHQQVQNKTKIDYQNPHPYTTGLQTSYKDPH
jgi:hypothetical protein